MRGLCKDSFIDSFWIPQNNNEDDDDRFYYAGLTSSRIYHNAATEEWDLSTFGKKKNPSGATDSNLHGILLGRSNWFIKNDGK